MLTRPEDDAAAEARALARRSRGHIASYGVGRRCDFPGCETALSRYNTGTSCSLHDAKAALPGGSSTRA